MGTSEHNTENPASTKRGEFLDQLRNNYIFTWKYFPRSYRKKS